MLNRDKQLAEKAIFTTGEIARIVMVAPRTVTKWCERGLLPHYKIPGSHDRRVKRKELVDFLRRHGLPLGPLEAGAFGVLLVGCPAGTWGDVAACLTLEENTLVGAVEVADPFTAGLAIRDRRPNAVAVWERIGRTNLFGFGRNLESIPELSALPLLAVVEESSGDGKRLAAASGYSDILQEPCGPADLAAWVRKSMRETPAPKPAGRKNPVRKPADGIDTAERVA